MNQTDPQIDMPQQQDCPVCGDFKMTHEEYCMECTRWKRDADNLRKARLLRQRFGDII